MKKLLLLNLMIISAVLIFACSEKKEMPKEETEQPQEKILPEETTSEQTPLAEETKKEETVVKEKTEMGEAPKTWKVADGGGDNWDLGLYTNGGVVEIGSAASILAKYSSYSGTAKTCEIAAVYFEAESLNDIYDSQALSANNFAERIVDLSQLNTTSNVVFIVRTNEAPYNYAKVMVINNDGFLQGTADNRYVEVVVSYQMTAGVPYAL